MNRLGVKHWIFQRVSNALIVLFAVVLLATITAGHSYESLQALMSKPLVKVYLAITLLFAFGNSILAGWQIAGDYAKKMNLSPGVMTWFGVLVSAAYLLFGLSLIF